MWLGGEVVMAAGGRGRREGKAGKTRGTPRTRPLEAQFQRAPEALVWMLSFGWLSSPISACRPPSSRTSSLLVSGEEGRRRRCGDDWNGKRSGEAKGYNKQGNSRDRSLATSSPNPLGQSLSQDVPQSE